MNITRSFNYAETSRQLLQHPGVIRHLTEIHESNGELSMLARTNERLLSVLESSRKFRDLEFFCKNSGLDISESRLRALIHKRVVPNGSLQQMALTYWNMLGVISKCRGESNPPRLQEEDLLSVDLFSATVTDSVGKNKNENSDSVPDLMSLIEFYHQTNIPKPDQNSLTAGMIGGFNKAAADPSAAPLLAILCLVIDYRYVQEAFRGLRQNGNLPLMYLLTRHGFVCGRYSSIEKKLGQETKDGEKAFRESTRDWVSGKNDYFPYVHFILENILAVYRDILSQLRPVLVGGRSRPERILQFIKDHKGYVPKRAIVEAHSDICLRSMEKILNDLTEDGRIRKYVDGRKVEFRFIRDSLNPDNGFKNNRPEFLRKSGVKTE